MSNPCYCYDRPGDGKRCQQFPASSTQPTVERDCISCKPMIQKVKLASAPINPCPSDFVKCEHHGERVGNGQCLSNWKATAKRMEGERLGKEVNLNGPEFSQGPSDTRLGGCGIRRKYFSNSNKMQISIQLNPLSLGRRTWLPLTCPGGAAELHERMQPLHLLIYVCWGNAS